jgi:energy-coupling factor transport system substrate-specific component
MQNNSLTIKDIALIGVMTATLEAGKMALSFLPNVEVVSLFIILYTLFFGRRTVYAIFTFVLIEGCLYGFGIWWIMYLYIWPLLSLLTWLFRKHAAPLPYALLSGTFGLFFGALCAIPYFIIGGWQMAFTWWIAGIPYDIIHCVANFLLCLILFQPLYRCLNQVNKIMEH